MWNFIYECLLQNLGSTMYDESHSYTYLEILNQVKEHGENLKRILAPRSKCVVLCDKGLNAAIAVLSCWYADLIPVPLSKNYGAEHCNHIIDLIKPQIMICDNLQSLYNNFMCYCMQNHAFYNCQSDVSNESELADVAVIMCTSSTTGLPKGAMITNRGLRSNIRNIADYFKIGRQDTILIARPLYHCAVLTGEFLVSLYKGLHICFCDEKYNPLKILQYIEKYPITVLCGTPTLFSHLSVFLSRKGQTAHIKKVAISGECLSEKTARIIRSAFESTDIYHVYGLTEAGPRVTYLPPESFDRVPESVGRPLKDTYVRIVDVDDHSVVLSSNSVGLIQIKSMSVMKGYYKSARLTENALVDGWLNSGDIGYLDKMGFLYILSRYDDMIIKGGINIYPKEVENVINQLEEVEASLVYGIAKGVGQAIAVDIILNEDAKQMCKKDVMNNLAKVLPAYQLPDALNIVEEFKRNASGKVIRPRAGRR